jgi:hypothetical protein
MSIYDELKHDHEEVKQMLGELCEMTGRATRRKETLFEKFKAEMIAHSRAEEKVFYDAIKGKKEGKEDALEGYEEHHLVDIMLREMSRLDVNDDRWKAKLKVLKENIEHHIEEEENEIFDTAEDLLSEDEAEELGERFVTEKEKRLEREMKKAA